MSQEHQHLSGDQANMENQVFQTIIDSLLACSITYELLEHEPVYTMEQAREVCGNLPEQGVKVLFVRLYKSKKDFSYCLIVWTGNKKVDFKQIANSLGVKKIKLASPEEVRLNLGVEIGALSPFGYGNNYPIIFDSALLKQSELFINPGVHNKTIKLNPQDLRVAVKQSASSLHSL